MNVDNQVKLFEEEKHEIRPLSLSEILSNGEIPHNGVVQESMMKMFDRICEHEKIMCSISGGYDSDILLDMIIRCGGKEKTTFVFNNTGLEYDATKDHIKYLEDVYGIKIVELKPKKTIPNCCREYGVPFWSKYVSGMISRLQKHGFQWENGTLDELLLKYPNCKAALRWWCNDFKTKSGGISKFNIEYVDRLKEFMILNPPNFKISAACCNWSKKKPAHEFLKKGSFDLNCTGVRQKEGGARATSYKSCFDDVPFGPDNYRPLFWWSDLDKEAYKKFFEIIRSDCYEVWGMSRTGCAGCPFGKNFEEELELVKVFEPKRYKAVVSVFGQSYEYTRRFLEFRERKKQRKCEPDSAQTEIKGW